MITKQGYASSLVVKKYIDHDWERWKSLLCWFPEDQPVADGPFQHIFRVEIARFGFDAYLAVVVVRVNRKLLPLRRISFSFDVFFAVGVKLWELQGFSEDLIGCLVVLRLEGHVFHELINVHFVFFVHVLIDRCSFDGTCISIGNEPFSAGFTIIFGLFVLS